MAENRIYTPSRESSECRKFKADSEGNTAVNTCTEIRNTPNNPVYVDIVEDGAAGETKNIYSDATAVAKDTPTTIVSYTVPTDKIFYLKNVEVSGSNRALYKVKLDAAVNAVKRTYGSILNEDFPFFNYKLTEGQVILIEVTHSRPTVGDFEARILGNEVAE